MKRSDVDALAASVERSWNKNADVIGRVWARLRNVLALIVQGKGGNDLVETKRGKKFRGLDVPPEFFSENDEPATNNATTSDIVTPSFGGYLDLDDSDDEEDEIVDDVDVNDEEIADKEEEEYKEENEKEKINYEEL